MGLPRFLGLERRFKGATGALVHGEARESCGISVTWTERSGEGGNAARGARMPQDRFGVSVIEWSAERGKNRQRGHRDALS